jgi:hypothetical protein
MAFVKGQEKKGGRAKGSLNRSTKELKEMIHNIVEVQLETIEEDLQDLEAKDRLGILLKLVEYVLPKVREQKLDFSNLSDAEIDELINRITDESSRKN